MDIKKVLIANRGEIAVRIIRACRDLGLRAVAVYSECDRLALHVRYADEAYPIGGSPPAESYLRIDRIVETALRSGADAVHPGYGFLAENPDLARACRSAGLTFIGPPAEAMEAMGGKVGARGVAAGAGVPVVPGSDGSIPDEAGPAELSRIAASVGFPLFVKAVAGGGGKGMRLVGSPDELEGAVRAARSEATTSFGDPAVYFERRLRSPRHVEIQLLADPFGEIVPFVERECSIQRRHQKVLEESPSVAVTPEVRRLMAESAVAVARAAGYVNAGTVEFLLDESGEFYFLEMNTRLQVEHPITELVTGVDLVEWQIRIARGEPLALDRERMLAPAGHAIECRIYAEDPDNSFLPSPGRLTGLRVPAGPGVRRDDGGVSAGLEVPVFYDPLIAKLAIWGETREQAIARAARALGEYEVRGIKTSITFFRWLLEQPEFREGSCDTTYLDRALQARAGEPFLQVSAGNERVAVIATALHAAARRRAAVPGRRPAASGWKEAARREALE